MFSLLLTSEGRGRVQLLPHDLMIVKSKSSFKMSSYKNVTLDRNDAALMMRSMTRSMEETPDLTQLDIRLMMERIKVYKMQLDLCFMLKDFQMAGKPSKDPNQDKDSQSLLAEQEDVPSQGTSQEDRQQGGSRDEGRSQGQGGEWKCQKCPKSFKWEKTLKNHVAAKHGMDETLNESNFAPSRTSSLAVDEDNSRKRKREGDDDGDSIEEGARGRGRLETVEEEVNFDLLDDTFSNEGARPSTQGVFEEAAEALRNAERVLVDVNDDEGTSDPDESMERDKDKALTELEKKLKIKDDLLHLRNGKLAEKEADLAECKELSDQKDRIIRKAHEEIKRKEEELERMRKKLEEKEREAREGSPESRKKLKTALEKLEKSAATVKCVTGRFENMKKDLDVARRTIRQHESENATFKKVEDSLECTLAKLAEVEKELDKCKKERAALQKRIPCTRENCQWGADCENSHQLRYEDRSEPKNPKWKKTVPCRFFLNGHCYKTEDKCGFLHTRPQESRDVEEEGFEDEEDDVFRLENQRFRRVVETEGRDSSVEFLGERRISWGAEAPQGGRMPRVPMPGSQQGNRFKKRKTDSWSEAQSSSMPRSGNGGGAEEWSRRTVPVNYQRPAVREPTLRMRMEAGRRSLDRSLGESSEGTRQRNWSPVRSPENLDRSRPRDRDLREEMQERRNQRGGGRGRGQPQMGRGMRRNLGMNNNPEDKDLQPRSGRRFNNQNHQ